MKIGCCNKGTCLFSKVACYDNVKFAYINKWIDLGLSARIRNIEHLYLEKSN